MFKWESGWLWLIPCSWREHHCTQCGLFTFSHRSFAAIPAFLPVSSSCVCFFRSVRSSVGDRKWTDQSKSWLRVSSRCVGKNWSPAVWTFAKTAWAFLMSSRRLLELRHSLHFMPQMRTFWHIHNGSKPSSTTRSMMPYNKLFGMRKTTVGVFDSSIFRGWEGSVEGLSGKHRCLCLWSQFSWSRWDQRAKGSQLSARPDWPILHSTKTQLRSSSRDTVFQDEETALCRLLLLRWIWLRWRRNRNFSYVCWLRAEGPGTCAVYYSCWEETADGNWWPAWLKSEISLFRD